MTKDEIREVWAYLGTYRAGDKRLQDKALANAWWRALKGYEAKDVKAAIDTHFRNCKFFPDLGEIFPLLPVQGGSASVGRDMRDYQPDPVVQRWRQAYRDELVPARKAAGIPATLTEARAAGLSVLEWMELLDGCGLGLDNLWRKRHEPVCCRTG